MLKRFISVLSLYVGAVFRKCIILALCMTGFNVLHTYVFYTDGSALRDALNEGTLGSFGNAIYHLGCEAGFLPFEILLFVFLALSPVSKGKSIYTVTRLGVPGRSLYLINALGNFLWTVLFRISRGIAVLWQCHILEKNARYAWSKVYPYLIVISDPVKLRSLLLNNKVAWALVLVEMVLASLIAAGINSVRIKKQVENGEEAWL